MAVGQEHPRHVRLGREHARGGLGIAAGPRQERDLRDEAGVGRRRGCGCGTGRQALDHPPPRFGPTGVLDRGAGAEGDDEGALVGRERLLRLELVREHAEVRFRGVGAAPDPVLDAPAQRRLGRVERDDDERDPVHRCEPAQQVALPSRKKRCVDDGDSTRADDVGGKRARAPVGLLGRLGCIEPPAHRRAALRAGRQPEEPLALDVGAHADRARLLDERLRHRRLAAAGQAARDDDGRPRRPRVAPSEPQVAAELREQALACGSGGKLARAQRVDLRAHHRAVDEIEAQHREARVVVGCLDPGVDEPVREVRPPAVLEIHRGEGDLAHDVDEPEVVVELDAIEDHELAVDFRNVAEVKVAVAFAHEAVFPAPAERGRTRREFGLRPRAECLERSPVGGILDQWQRLREVLPRVGEDVLRGAVRPVGRRDRDPPVERGDHRRERVDALRREPAAREQAGSKRVLGELAHLDRVFLHWPAAADDRRVGRTGDRDHVEVEGGGEPPVQPQFLFAAALARRERAEIEESERDRLLDLVGVAPGQQHVRDVRFEALHSRATAAPHGGIGERGDEPRLLHCGISDDGGHPRPPTCMPRRMPQPAGARCPRRNRDRRRCATDFSCAYAPFSPVESKTRVPRHPVSLSRERHLRG